MLAKSCTFFCICVYLLTGRIFKNLLFAKIKNSF